MLIVLVIISAVSGCIAVALAHRLWGGWTAVYVTAVGWQWVQREAFGGSEPLFMALVLGSFLSLGPAGSHATRGAVGCIWPRSSAPLASSRSAPCSFDANQPRCSDWALACAAIGGFSALYCVPLAFTGDVLGNIHWYAPQMTGGTVWGTLIAGEVSPVRDILVVGAITVVLMAPFVVFAREQKGRWAENLFALGTSCFLITLNCQPCAWAFPRFAIVSIPFALIVLRRWVPRDDRVVCVLSIVSALIAAAMQFNDRAPGTAALLHLFSLATLVDFGLGVRTLALASSVRESV